MYFYCICGSFAVCVCVSDRKRAFVFNLMFVGFKTLFSKLSIVVCLCVCGGGGGGGGGERGCHYV